MCDIAVLCFALAFIASCSLIYKIYSNPPFSPALVPQLEKLTPEEMMELEDVEPEESKLSWDFE